MTKLHINIKDDDKAIILLNLLKELPFVEIEAERERAAGRTVREGKGDLADLFGLWENRDITLNEIRKKAWKRN